MNLAPSFVSESASAAVTRAGLPPGELVALREKIAGLEAVKCRMAHERVRHDPQTGQPIPECLPELGYQRIGFCPKSERDKRIACGHTMARYILEEGVNALPEPARSALGAELRDVTNAIHALDHQKGDAEKRLAQLAAADAPPSPPILAEAHAAVRAIDDRHGAFVDRIARVQHAVLAGLDALIAARAAPPGICH